MIPDPVSSLSARMFAQTGVIKGKIVDAKTDDRGVGRDRRNHHRGLPLT